MFTDRMDAGAFLATKLLHLKDKDPVVFAPARGGVPVIDLLDRTVSRKPAFETTHGRR